MNDADTAEIMEFKEMVFSLDATQQHVLRSAAHGLKGDDPRLEGIRRAYFPKYDKEKPCVSSDGLPPPRDD